MCFMWCRWRGSNPHGVLAHRILSPARLPIPSHRLVPDYYNLYFFKNQEQYNRPGMKVLFPERKTHGLKRGREFFC